MKSQPGCVECDNGSLNARWMEQSKARKRIVSEPVEVVEERVVTRFKGPKPTYFFKQWRKYRSLTQEQLASRVDMAPASVSQLERGLQGFTDSTLEAFAMALNCHPGDILMRNPLDTEGPWSIWDQLKPAQRRQALKVLQALAEAA